LAVWKFGNTGPLIKFSLNLRPVKGVASKEPSPPLTDVTWKTFKDTDFLRKDAIYENMEGKWDAGPFGSYHCSCYQMYIARSHIERILRKRRLEKYPIMKRIQRCKENFH